MKNHTHGVNARFRKARHSCGCNATLSAKTAVGAIANIADASLFGDFFIAPLSVYGCADRH